MILKTHILTLVIACSISLCLCTAVHASEMSPLTTFYLDSAIGKRFMENGAANPSADAADLRPAMPPESPRKSPNEAFFYSLILPGAGQLYTGAKRGYLYAAIEVGLFTTYFILRHTAANTRNDYRDLVRKNVIFDGLGSFDNWDLVEDFEHATQYDNWNHVYDSETTRARTGKWYWADLDPALKDEKSIDIPVGSGSKLRLESFDLRQKANNTFERARTFLGLVILNHVVSAVEARITTKRFNKQRMPTGQVDNLKQGKFNAFEIDVQTNVTAGVLESTLVFRKRF